MDIDRNKCGYKETVWTWTEMDGHGWIWMDMDACLSFSHDNPHDALPLSPLYRPNGALMSVRA